MIVITDKKRILVSSIFILAIFLSSCSKQTPNQTSDKKDESLLSKAGGLASALVSGDSYKCSYTNDKDQSQGEYLVKNKMFRVDGQEGADGQKSSIILNDMGMYMWAVGETKGFFYPTVKEDDSNKTNSKSPVSEFDDYLNPEKLDEKEKIDCKKASVSDSVFVPPVEVKFEDFTKMMESFTNPSKTGTDLPNIDLENLPSSVEDQQ